MTLISLFAGVGGFDLGFERAGFRTVGQCEIDPHAVSVLERHWPDVPKHDDVATLKVSTFGPADVVTFGSPCQDLSVAGKRAGLDGERSGLFLEAVRFIREMLEATNGEYPRWAVWENVVGAFSSSGGDDFAAVLESLVGGEVRRPPGGWAYAGVAFGPLGAAEWRVLDSQHFGVAQRRRRVFVVYHPGSERAGQVLLEPQGVRGDTPQGREAREGAPAASQARPGSSGAAWGLSGEFNAALDLQPTLQHDSPSGGGQKPMVGVPTAFVVRGGKEGGGKGYLGSEDQALTLDTTQSQYLAEPVAFDLAQITSKTNRSRAEPGLPAGTLAANSDPHVAVAFEPRFYSDRERMGGAPDDRSGPLKATDGKAGDAAQHVATPYAVRRLTPVECERLQNFPDSWTALDHKGREIADTHRYRMMGNAVTVSVAEWIAHRLKEALS